MALAGGGCRKPPPEQTPEGTLGLLRQSLATSRPPLDRVADTHVLSEARLLHLSTSAESTGGVTLTNTAVEVMSERIRAEGTPERFFPTWRTLLQQGHCEKLGDARPPEGLRSVPQPHHGHAPRARELQTSVARRMTNVIAGDFRCDQGPAFLAAFTRPIPNDNTWRVAYLGPASRAY